MLSGSIGLNLGLSRSLDTCDVRVNLTWYLTWYRFRTTEPSSIAVRFHLRLVEG